MSEKSDALAVPVDVTMRRPTLFGVPATPILPAPLVVRRAQAEEAGALASLLGRAFEAESWDAAGAERELFCDETVRATLVVAAEGRLMATASLQDSTGARALWQPSPDTLEVRQHLLALLDDIQAKPTSEYPIGVFADELVVWQLGEFQERRAVAGLQRIASFDPRSEEDGPFRRTRQDLVKLAQEALAKIARAGGHG